VKIKICGLRRVSDAELAVSLGATHVGVVRAPTSPRCASLDEARAIFTEVGERASTVLVCKDMSVEQMIEEADEANAGAVQMYGWDEESVGAVAATKRTVLRVFSIDRAATKVPSLVPTPTVDSPAVLDVGGGGTGERFAWGLLGRGAPNATFIAGGIGPDNIEELIRFAPYGVDLSSRLESSPGIKDASKMRAFFRAAERALARRGLGVSS
jgi:phosphoribosylanthranilate isomerase